MTNGEALTAALIQYAITREDQRAGAEAIAVSTSRRMTVVEILDATHAAEVKLAGWLVDMTTLGADLATYRQET